VEEGPRFLVGSVRLDGNRTVPSARLLDLVKTRPGRPYVEADFKADVEALASFYRGEGFLGAEANVGEQNLDPGRGQADLTIVVREGVRTVVREVELRGTQRLPVSTILPVLRLRPDGPLREEDLEADRFAILDRYGQEGYIYAAVSTNLDFSPDRASARVVHTVEEKHQARLRSLLVVGNERTRGRVFRREIPLLPGDPYRYQAVLDGQQRIYQLGIVRSLRLVPLEPELEPEEVDLLLRVEERDAGRFAVGVGYSSEERLRGFVEVGHRNLWGTARAITLRLRLSEISHRADLLYLEPWVLRRRVDGEVNLFTDFREERGFDIRRSGLSLGLRREFTPALRAAVRYRLEDVTLTGVTGTTALLGDEGEHTTSSLSLNPSADTRDDLLDPTRGQTLGLTLTGAGGVLGGTDDFLKAEGEGSWFFSLPGLGVLGLSLRAGVAQPYGRSDRVPIHERFFAGGSHSIRGFGDKRLGPKDPGGTPLGGEALLLVSGEFRVPLYQALGGVVFLEGGQVWLRRSDVALRVADDLQWAVGSGLRLKTPLGPIRLDYGYRLREERGEDRWRLHFTLGHAF
jgi:outer membrane protein insertion porin family